MASRIMFGFMVSLILFHLNSERMIVVGLQQVPCYFVFGDSLADNGNNNYLATIAKANYPPYGIDFVNGSTGRFTNGQTTVDYIARSVGLNVSIPPFASLNFNLSIPPLAITSGGDITRGVNYASGGAGIRDETGFQLGYIFSLNRQLMNHQQTILRLSVLQQNITYTKEYLRKCIYTVGMGSNDYINNYLLPLLYPSSLLFTPDQFAQELIDMYYEQLRILYRQGARKVAIFGLGRVGCAPAVAAQFPANGSLCAENVNAAVQLFDQRLKPLVQRLNSELPGAMYTYINISSITGGIFSADGITLVNVPCCVLIPGSLCEPNSIPCNNRAQYRFYDGYHPTEFVYNYTATRAYNAASPMDAYPYDISQLAQL